MPKLRKRKDDIENNKFSDNDVSFIINQSKSKIDLINKEIKRNNTKDIEPIEKKKSIYLRIKEAIVKIKSVIILIYNIITLLYFIKLKFYYLLSTLAM